MPKTRPNAEPGETAGAGSASEDERPPAADEGRPGPAGDTTAGTGAREERAAEAATPVARIANRGIGVLNVIALAIFAIGAVGELAVMIGNIVARAVFSAPFAWVFEIAELAMPLMVFSGGAWAYAADKHLRLDLLTNRFGVRWTRPLNVFADGWVLVTALITLKLTLPGGEPGQAERTQILKLPQSYYNDLLILGMVILSVYCVLRILRHPGGEVLRGLGLLAVVAAVEILLAETMGGSDLEPSAATPWLVAATFTFSLLMGVPIAFVLLSSSILYLEISGAAPLSSIPIALMSSTQNFVNLAIPFFILAGIILTYGGLSTRLTAFVESLVRRVRGGLLHAVVLSMYLFSGLSGSKIADVAAVGSAMRGGLEEEGYPSEDTAAVLASSAVMGEAVPPSLVMLILGSVTSISISDLFLGGLIPAMVVGVAIMVLIYVRSPKRPRKPPLGLRRRAGLAVGAAPALVVPVVLIGGVVTGVASPTEVSAVAVVLALVLLLTFRRSGRPLLPALKDTCGIGGMVLMIVSAASAFSYSLTIAGFPDLVTRLFDDVGGNRFAVLLATIVLVPIIGMVLEGAPAVLVLAPLLVPIAAAAGIDQVQYGILFVLAIGLGTYAPPMGVGLYAVCAVSGARLSTTARRLVPYWATIVCTVVLIALVPAISLWLPHALGKH